MKRIAMILLMLFGCLLFAQNDRFIYQVSFKKDSTSNEITKENYHLDITGDGLSYYNRIYYINDSVYAQTGKEGFKGYRLTSFIVKNKNSSSYDNYEYIGDVNFYKTGTPSNLVWKISDSTKTVNELKVQKAETHFGGRKWTAWFTQEIPLSYGPYKFGGLPGLITEIYDSRKNYIFTLIKSEKIPGNYESYSLKERKSKAVKVNDKKLNDLKLELYQSPFKYVFNGKLSIPEGKRLQLDDGTILTKEELKPAEKNERKKMKSFNNPVELDKAVQYPAD
ncbi:MAG: GLPGLI family protein [Chryseobacterium sp.]|jgi:GLPGLI family protein|nr:GLPGLI family protein [Chryseobacterium sp.]